jgi:hypothetical protein
MKIVRAQMLSVVALGVFGLLAAGSDDGSSSKSVPPSANASKEASVPAPETAPAPAPPDSAEILNDAKALDDKYGIEATSYCASRADDYLKTAAKYDYKWDDVGFFETKFDHFRLLVKSPGVLVMTTDKVKFQNGFGAFQRVDLSCDYDTQNKLVLGYSLSQR